jgi:hypothetical protein
VSDTGTNRAWHKNGSHSTKYLDNVLGRVFIRSKFAAILLQRYRSTSFAVIIYCGLRTPRYLIFPSLKVAIASSIPDSFMGNSMMIGLMPCSAANASMWR